MKQLIAGMLIALGGNVLAVMATVRELWWIPRGTSIRPLGLMGVLLLVAVVTVACVGVVVGMAMMKRSNDWRAWVIAVVAVLVSLGPLPVARVTYDWIEARHGLVSEP